MATPRGKTYTAVSGANVAGGRYLHALAQLAYSLSPGEVGQLPCPSLYAGGSEVVDSTGSQSFRPPPESGNITPLLDWSSNFPYCPTTGRIICSAGRPASVAAGAKLIFYDLEADTWDSISNPFNGPTGHFYQSQCLSVERRRFFYLSVHAARAVDMWDTENWQDAGSLPAIPGGTLGSGTWSDAICLSWHPNLGSQGSLVAANGITNYARIARFDWASQTWSALYDSSTQGFAGDGHWAGIYVPGADACLVGKSSNTTPTRLFRVAANGTVTQTALCPSLLAATAGKGILAAHPSRAAAIHFCPQTDKIWSYEFESDTWVDRGPLPSCFDIPYQAGSTIHELGVIFSVRNNGAGSDAIGTQTWVYKPDF